MEKENEITDTDISDNNDEISLSLDFDDDSKITQNDVSNEEEFEDFKNKSTNDKESFSQEDLLQKKNPHGDNESNNRFYISEKAKVENKIVLYVENLHVSFKNRISKKDKVKYEIENPSISWEEYKEQNRVKHVIKGLSFYLKEGETLAIIGANGAGKTVLMETILGYNKNQKGEIYLNLGEKTYDENKKRIGFQFQDSSFPNNWTVKQWIEINKKIFEEYIDEEQIREMLNIFKIKDFYLQKISQLSGGQKQRLNLFLAIIHNPKLMILDEFITGLDIISVKEIINYVNSIKIKNNASMMIISHQPEEVEMLADRIIVLKDGKVSKEITPEEAKEQYGNIGVFMEENINE